MKKTFIKLVSVFTAIMIISGMLAGINFSTVNAVESLIFSDGFDYANGTAMANAGWVENSNADNTATTLGGFLSNGKISVTCENSFCATLGGVSSTTSLTDYSVETEVVFNSEEITDGTALVGLLGRANGKNGYELGLVINKNGRVQARLRTISTSNTTIGTATTVLSSYTAGQVITLKMTFSGTTIKCFVNSDEVFSVTDSTFSSGTAGIKGIKPTTGKIGATFDNFKITAEKNEYFNMPFTGTYTSGALTAMGYAATGDKIADAAGYISNGVITYANTRSSTSAFYNTSFNSDNYTVEATAKVNETPSGDATFGITAGESTTQHKTGFYFYLTINRTEGTIQSTRLSYLPDYKGSDASTFATENISKTERPAMGTEVNLKLTISYDRVAKVTTATGVLSVGGTALSTLTISRNGKISGYSALYLAKTCAVSFDNFKAVPYTSPAESNLYFYDDFDDNKTMTENGWNSDSNTTGTKANGVYTIKASMSQYTNGVKDADKWTDYAVTSKVKLNLSALPTNNSTYAASIVARSTDKHNQGFEFGIRANKSGTYYQLYKRGVSGGKINGEEVKLTKEISLTDFQNLKMIVMGKRVLCYNGEELIFDVTDKQEDNLKYDAGYAGMRAATADPVFDEFIVRKITDAEKQAIEALNPPTPPSPPAGDDDDSGDDTDDTPTDENIMYSDDFNNDKAMGENGWNSNSAGTKADGVYTAGYNKAVYLTKVEGADKWDDYVVEADIRYNSGTIDEGVSTAVNIVARSTSTAKNGYEFGFTIDAEGNTYLRLYKRGNSGGKINNVENKLPYTVLPDTDYHAKLVVLGNRILCYLNGMKVFDVVDNEATTYDVGYAGVRNAGATDKVGYTSSYDNFVVRKILTTDIVEDKTIEKLEGDIWFKDGFDGETSLSERGWNTDSAEFKNGKASLVRTVNNMYISGVKGAEKWTDYTVTATVEVDKTQGTFGGQTMGASWIVARSTNLQLSGYEFGIMSYQSGKYNLRLYDRTDKEDILVVNNYNVTEGAHELKMICQGNVIRCYYDGELVITATDDTNKAGYAGIRASGFITNYDNFTVSTIKEEQKLNIPTVDTQETVKSPVTGVARVACTVVAPISFALSSVALIITAAWAIINRKKIF